MFILKVAGKIVLLPVWVVLVVIGIAVKILVQMYSIVHGIFGVLLVGLILGTAICYHDWVQVQLWQLPVLCYIWCCLREYSLIHCWI